MGRIKTVEQFLADTMAVVRPLDPLNFAVGDTQGCVLAEDVSTELPVPARDEAGVDGYAARAEDVAGASADSPVKLAVIGEAGAGGSAPESIRAHQAARVRRGVPVPVGADCVVPATDTDGGVVTVHVRAAAVPGANVNREGSDLPGGTAVLKSGDTLSPARVGLLAAMGRARVLAHPRPRVVVVSLGGGDVVPPRGARDGRRLPARSHDVTGVALGEAVRDAGASAYLAGMGTDSPQELATAVEDHLIRADVVLTAGGMGRELLDVVPRALGSLGDVTFDTVDCTPGGPVGFGFVGPERLPVFCLPGDPVAALVEFEILVRPMVLRLAAAQITQRTRIRARSAATFASPPGVRQFVGVTLGRADDEWVALPVSGGTMRLPQLAASHGLIDVPAATSRVSEGDQVSVLVTDEAAVSGLRLSVS